MNKLGTKITRKQALEIALQILAEAERARQKIAEDEANIPCTCCEEEPDK